MYYRSYRQVEAREVGPAPLLHVREVEKEGEDPWPAREGHVPGRHVVVGPVELPFGVPQHLNESQEPLHLL
jgi:hypothetical protein